ncbi:MAG TPA: glycosyl hydrolase family 28-related protein [Pyrinomonadaceae bacterium]|jgi:polygalacturonase
MKSKRVLLSVTVAIILVFFGISYKTNRPSLAQSKPQSALFNVRDFGAKGDGKTLDSPAINRTIEAAAKAGGGTVFFPAGTYRSFSVRLKSNITLYFDQGSVLLAANPTDGDGKYDAPEPNQ